MGTVWHARHPEGVDVAVKVVRPEYAAQPEQAEAFRKEVRSVAFLDHPGIVRVYDFGVVPDSVAEASQDRIAARSLWLSMEFAEGGTLGDWPQLGSWTELRPVLRQILRALGHAHARGIIHRDLKPRNVLVFPQGADQGRLSASGSGGIRVGLTDYGIAHALHRESADRAQAGTPGYMAPEQIRGDWRDLGPWTDLYSLGCLAWRLATGRSPFPGERAPAVLFAQLNARMRPFEAALTVPKDFEAWVTRLVEVEPRNRFPCAADAEQALLALDEGRPNRSRIPLDWGEDGRSADVSDGSRTGRPRGTGLALFVYRPWPLVGRVGVQDALWSAFRTVAGTGRARVLLLSGHSGVGKTRLATWLAERVEELGVAWTLRPAPGRSLRTSSRTNTGSFARPGVALPTAVRRLLRLEELPAEEAQRRLASALQDRGSTDAEAEATEVLALLDRAFILGEVAYSTLTPDEESNRSWLALFDRLAHDRPLVLVLEDLHVEPQVVGLLEALIGTERPVLVVATVDRAAQPANAAAMRRLQERAQVLELEPLDETQHRAMIDVGVGLCPRLADQVVERTLGDPSLTVRLVTDWVRRSLLVPTSQGFDLKEGADPRLSPALCESLAARLDGIGPARTEVLVFLAALAPRRVRYDEWESVCLAAKRPLREDIVSTLVARGLLATEQSADGQRFTLVPQALREAILHRARQHQELERVHSLCAEVLVSRPRASAHERAVVHFTEAGLPEVALHHLRELIDRTLAEAQWKRLPQLLAYERQLFDDLTIPTGDSRRFRNQVDELISSERLGGAPDVGRARQILTQTAEGGDPGTSARLALLITRAEAREGTLRADDLLLLQARRWAQDAGDADTEVRLIRLAGEAAWRRRDVAMADSLLSDAAAMAEQSDDRVAVLALLGEVRGLSGSPEQGAVLVARALELALRSGSRQGLANAMISQSLLSRYRGDAAGALDLAYRAVTELQVIEEDLTAAELQIGLALLLRGDTESATEVLERVAQGDDPDRRVVAKAGLLACAAADPRERSFDAALAVWRTVAQTDRGYHPDTVWPLEWAAQRSLDSGAVDRAQALYRLASARHLHLGDPGAAERADQLRRAISASSPGR
jgi:eukaryotic-like serine/threonine-protein kinase